MKKVSYILFVSVICLLSYSCGKENCTDNYLGVLKIDGKKGDKVLVKYVGPKKRNYESEFGFNSVENELPYYNYFMPNTICSSKDFKKNNYDFLEIRNLGTEDVYVFTVLEGPEIDRFSNHLRYISLARIYGKQDEDPNYDYTKDKSFEGIRLDYVNRYDFYEQLLKDKYPYIIKLAPQQTCIIRWGGGISML